MIKCELFLIFNLIIRDLASKTQNKFVDFMNSQLVLFSIYLIKQNV